MINITDEELNDSIQQLQMLLYKVSDVEDISVYAPVLKKLIAEHEAARGMEKKYNEIVETLYGQGLSVVGWHLNGDHAPLDNFFEHNDWLPPQP